MLDKIRHASHKEKETLTMSTALIVGGDQIDSIKQGLSNFGVTRINHWSGRKVALIKVSEVSLAKI